MLTFRRHSKKLQCSERTMLLLWLCATLSFVPCPSCFTELLLTIQNCCHQLNTTALLQFPFQTPPFCSMQHWMVPACPREGFYLTPFSLQSYKAFKDLCKGRWLAVALRTFQGTKHAEHLLTTPTVTLRLPCFMSLLKWLVHKQTKQEAHKAAVRAINTTHTQN